MDFLHDLNRFDLHDDSLVHPEVEPKALVEPLTLVAHRHGMLLKERNACISQFTSQTMLVNALEQSRPELSMNLNGRSNNRP